MFNFLLDIISGNNRPTYVAGGPLSWIKENLAETIIILIIGIIIGLITSGIIYSLNHKDKSE